jgi:hypothetical protein
MRRRLAREQHAAYAEIYEQVRPAVPTRHHACEPARTKLRYRYPARYLELFAEEQAGGLVIVQVSRWRLGVRHGVTDQGSSEQPVIRDTGPGREPAGSGHGLYMVAQLAKRLDDASGPASEPARLAQPA